MAFSSTLKPSHHQNQLRSFTFSNTFSHGFPILSPNKPSKPPPFFHLQAHITTQPTISRRILDKIDHGFSSFRSKDQRVAKKPLESDNSVTKIAKIAKAKDKHTRNTFDSKRRIDNGSGSSSLSSKDENISKRSKKGKLDSPEAVLRLGLEICSKQGDIMGAIGIHDLAKREGIKLDQYHYAVILYLCSSAAIGVVHPAKSGRSNSTSSKPELSNYNPVNYESLLENSDPTKINDTLEPVYQTLDGVMRLINDHNEGLSVRNGIRVGEDVKEYAIKRGFEIYKEMVSNKVSINEAVLTSLARMAMARDDGQMAFDIVKQMKDLGINPRLRSYNPALSVFCNTGNVEKAFEVEEHMLNNGVYPEEPELEALLRVSIEASRSDKVYYLLHKLRTSVRKVSKSTADLIEKWFKSKTASRIGKRKWDHSLINKAFKNGGGGWHGQGWLGKGKWNITRTFVGKDGLCKFCCEKLVTIDLDPVETENFAESVAKIARERDKNFNFEKFQKWLDYYGPFEAVIDGANVGLFSQRRFKPSKINMISNGIRQMLPSKKFPLIILHNRRLTGDKMDEGLNKTLIEKWKNADALYATPTRSNDDWYWLYAAIKFKCLLVTNDEMRDHLFQLLGNDFFPKWKERHQVRFHFSDTGPVYHMPPPCSVVIQESVKGHWHIPIASELDSEEERVWLCVTRDYNSTKSMQESMIFDKETERDELLLKDGSHGRYEEEAQEHHGIKNETISSFFSVNQDSILTQILAAEKLGGCVLDFQI